MNRLTSLEQDIFWRLLSDLPLTTIAELFGMRPVYLRQRAQGIYKKLGAKNRTSLMAKVIEAATTVQASQRTLER